MGSASEFSILFRKYTDRSATEAESMTFLHMADQDDYQEELAGLVDALIAGGSAEEKLDAEEQGEILANIYKAAGTKAGSRNLQLRKVLVVAAAVAAIAFGIWFFSAPRHPEPSLSSRAIAKDLNDIAPGKNTATIKIGDGKAITLSDKQSGIVIGNDLRYNDNTLVISDSNPSSRQSEATRDLLNSTNKGSLPYGRDDGRARMLTVTTPRGGTYQVTLPDGTKVWLNAASSLTYTVPLKERGGTRKVELSGEAYFEVFRNKNQPFVVTTKNLTTTVLGTHFNINAYDDETSTKATLLEGSVRVSSSGLAAPSSRTNVRDLLNSTNKRSLPAVRDDGRAKQDDVILKPNQQASLTAGQNLFVKEVNPQLAIAWQKGRFAYNNTPMAEVMRDVARWYDVAVTYESEALKSTLLSGSVNRYEKLSGILNALAYTSGLNYKLEDRTVWIFKAEKK